MSGVTTRDALNVALREWFPMGSARVADALLASGVVIDAATLADDLCKRICDLLGDPRALVPGEVSALLAAALSERTS